MRQGTARNLELAARLKQPMRASEVCRSNHDRSFELGSLPAKCLEWTMRLGQGRTEPRDSLEGGAGQLLIDRRAGLARAVRDLGGLREGMNQE